MKKSKLDIAKFAASIESVMTDTELVMSRLADTSSMAFIFVIFAAFAIALYALMKYTSQKRLD